MFANLAGVLDFADSFEEKLNTLLTKISVVEQRFNLLEQHVTVLNRKVDEIQTIARRNQEKVMEGFRCIEKAFKVNCGAQMAMSEQIDEMTGSMCVDFEDLVKL